MGRLGPRRLQRRSVGRRDQEPTRPLATTRRLLRHRQGSLLEAGDGDVDAVLGDTSAHPLTDFWIPREPRARRSASVRAVISPPHGKTSANAINQVGSGADAVRDDGQGWPKPPGEPFRPPDRMPQVRHPIQNDPPERSTLAHSRSTAVGSVMYSSTLAAITKSNAAVPEAQGAPRWFHLHPADAAARVTDGMPQHLRGDIASGHVEPVPTSARANSPLPHPRSSIRSPGPT